MSAPPPTHPSGTRSVCCAVQSGNCSLMARSACSSVTLRDKRRRPVCVLDSAAATRVPSAGRDGAAFGFDGAGFALGAVALFPVRGAMIRFELTQLWLDGPVCAHAPPPSAPRMRSHAAHDPANRWAIHTRSKWREHIPEWTRELSTERVKQPNGHESYKPNPGIYGRRGTANLSPRGTDKLVLEGTDKSFVGKIRGTAKLADQGPDEYFQC